MTSIFISKKPESARLSKLIILHLAPGLALTLVFVFISPLIFNPGLPPLIGFLFAVSITLLPLESGYLYYLTRRKGVPFRLASLTPYRDEIGKGLFGVILLLSLCWAIIIFMTTGPTLAVWMKVNYFGWWPDHLTPGNYLKTPELYSRNTIIFTWFLMGLASIIIPLTEELYFRGYLMSKLPWQDFRTPLLNTILFCAYHFWSPWLFVTRVLAVFPVYYFAWKKRNVYLAISFHIILNLVGDVLLPIPEVFGLTGGN